MPNSISQSVPVLKALWRLVQRGAPFDVAALARESELTPARVRRHLGALEAARLVDAGRRRLTLQGLALAVAASPGRRRRRDPRVLRAGALRPVMLPVVSFGVEQRRNASATPDEARRV
ncbi:MAG TPA: hypothetical protein VK524_29100 [Polyangiaceae bacterium]|nr:hypothetical protein [Polyangiaceae bacterium]